MRSLLLVTAMFATAACGAECTVRSGAETNALVELYTSQGCSSCPPAERWLSRLSKQSRAGVVPIAFHVHYWDYIGWKDAYADPRHTERQQAFARATGSQSVYTPQVIVGGVDFRAWADTDTFDAALKRLRSTKPGAAIELAPRLHNDGSVEGTARALPAAPGRNLALVVALTQDGIATRVSAGENKGETLAQDAVVRDVTEFRGSGTLTGNFRFTPKADWDARHLSVVAYVQDLRSGRILQALSAPACPG